jgi:L-malate glycosyltransferase
MSKIRNKVRVAFVLWTLEGMGGSEKVVLDLARKIDKTAFEVFIVSFSEGPVRKLYEELGLKVFSVTKEKRLDIKFIRSLRTLFSEQHIDVVNAHHFGPFLYSTLSAYGTKCKVIYTEHSRWQLEELSPLKKVLNRALLTKADGVVAISRQIEKYYISKLYLGRNKVHLITNGIEIGQFGDRNGSKIRKGLGIGENDKVIGTIANLRPEKNHKLLIGAFSEVARVFQGASLVLVGLDCMDGQVQRFASESGASERIHFLGRRDDVPDLLGLFDVFCLPSIHEGLPLTVLEAMSAGVPVIGADVLGINEVITDNMNGLLFPSNDMNKLSEVILQLLTDHSLMKRLSEAANLFVAEQYNLDKKVREYEELFHTVFSSSLY